MEQILEKKMIDVKLSFDQLFKILEFDNYNTPSSKDIEELGIMIESYDIQKKEKVFKPLTHLVIKEEVDSHYEIIINNEILKTTSSHRTLQNDEWIESILNPLAILVNEPMKVVDITVKDTECYIANGQINHNTTPGGKAIAFFATIRVYLSGKTPIILPDPYTEHLYNEALDQYEKDIEQWKLDGKNPNRKPEKPKKQDFKGDDILVGYDVTAKTEKNKIAPPIREADFRIIFSEGVVDEQSWLNYGIKFGLIKETSKRGEFQVNGFDVVFKRNEWLDVVCDAEIHEYVKNGIIKNIVRPSNAPSKELSTISEIDDDLNEEPLKE